MEQRKTIGFIGLGNMARAMIGGMLQKGAAEKEYIIGSARTAATCEHVAEQYGIVTYSSNAEVARQADILFLAVKPQFFPEVIGEIRSAVHPQAVIVSIAAGKTMEEIGRLFGGERKLVRCMPNTPALVLEGCTGVCANDRVSPEELAEIMELLCSFGLAETVPERLMDAVGGVSGSSPAYVFLFLEALADGAVAAGMPRRQAYTFAAQAVLGSAKLMLETGKHPGELKDMVCSPGGTTIQAIKVLEEKGMRAAVMDAMEACIERTRSL